MANDGRRRCAVCGAILNHLNRTTHCAAHYSNYLEALALPNLRTAGEPEELEDEDELAIERNSEPNPTRECAPLAGCFWAQGYQEPFEQEKPARAQGNAVGGAA